MTTLLTRLRSVLARAPALDRPVIEQAIAALEQADALRAALVEIAAIKDQEYGLDWEEIELARSIANTALAARGAGE